MFLSLWMALAMAKPPVAAEMHQRYNLLTEARDYVIQGDLAKARQAAADLAAVEPPRRLPKVWRPWVAQLDTDAGAVAHAEDLLAASLQVGRAAASCGACHEVTRGGPSLEMADGIPEQAWQEGMNMPLHRWSMDWMWLGLIANDDAAWRRGASELDSQPLAMRFEGAPPSSKQTQLEQLVYVLAGQALDAQGAERGALMGKLIATCAECHNDAARAPLVQPVQEEETPVESEAVEP